ncbi:MAG: NOB1 family endonuclease [Candidatus Thorarchaeota archaeon]
MKEKNSIYIFDTNIFLTGIDFNVIRGVIYTTPSIVEEVKASKFLEKNRNILNKINAAIESKKLKTKHPKGKYLTLVKQASKKTGDFNALSDADKELIALTLELIKTTDKMVKIYSNDYSIENVCVELNIPFSSLYKNGIESKIIWQIYCPYCKTIHKAEDFNQVCEICGSKLKRRPKNKIIY